MMLKKELLKRIERKQQEVKELELQIREAQAYVLGLQDTLKLLPRDASDAVVTLRPGSDLAKARDSILGAGAPMHLVEILKAQGKTVDKKSRLALGGSIARYARNGQVFVKTGPNIFGLLELGSRPAAPVVSEPPDDFGEMGGSQ